MDYKYVYILMGALFFLLWIFLFIWRKDVRKEMLNTSFLFVLAGPISEIAYYKDYWRPANLTNTQIGVIEALFFAFALSGVATVLYEIVLRKNLRGIHLSKKEHIKRNQFHHLVMWLLPGIFFLVFFVLGFNSLIATIFAFGVPILIMYIQRSDLIIDSLFTGIFILLFAMIVYSFLEYVSPGWVHNFYLFKNVPDIVIFNVPIDDVIWYFMAGLFFGPLYAYRHDEIIIESTAKTLPDQVIENIK